MGLTAGMRIGCYEVVDKTGAGGMGEVYRAKDTRLKREVALKVLPSDFANNTDRMARFQREMVVLAALNHPNIATIYGTEEGAAVMELVPGRTLEERISEGPLPWEEALPVFFQIVDALEYAHEHRVVHRDLKPGNIKITPEGRVKVLDFGLAAALQPESTSSDPGASPTITMQSTESGILIGTAAYMSPEQARGKPADQRTDIWAFCVVVYDVLTGKNPFAAETVTDTLAAVLMQEPSFGRIPAQVCAAVTRCLRKDPRARWRHIADVRFALEDATDGIRSTAVVSRRLPRGWIAPVILFGFALATGSMVLWGPAVRTQRVSPVQFQIPMPEKAEFTGHVSISPDGRHAAFSAAASGGPSKLWLRAMDSMEAHPIPATDNAGFFFWSPDSRFIAYWTGGKLKKVSIANDQQETICDLSFELGGTWRKDGLILIGNNVSGLQRVSATGGHPLPVTRLDASRLEIYHAYPYFLPDGRHFIYRIVSDRPDTNGLYLAELNESGQAQNSKRLVDAQSGAIYVPRGDEVRSGFLLYLRNHALVGQPFNTRRGELIGDAFLVAPSVGRYLARGFFSASETGTLLYRPGGEEGAQLTWFSREGRIESSVGRSSYADISLSPDGRLIAAIPDSASAAIRNVRILDPSVGRSSPLTFETSSSSFSPVWSPDSKRIAYARTAGTTGEIYVRDAAGAAREDIIVRAQSTLWPLDWSPDGNLILYSTAAADGKRELWVVSVYGEHTPKLYLPGASVQTHGQFSPDGNFVAYSSGESGRSEVYVQQFPAAGGKRQISTNGGIQPRWRHDGKELFFIGVDQKLNAVDVRTSPVFTYGAPRILFATRVSGGIGSTTFRYSVAPDGRRFLINSLSAVGLGSDPISVVLNWDADR